MEKLVSPRQVPVSWLPYPEFEVSWLSSLEPEVFWLLTPKSAGGVTSFYGILCTVGSVFDSLDSASFSGISTIWNINKSLSLNMDSFPYPLFSTSSFKSLEFPSSLCFTSSAL